MPIGPGLAQASSAFGTLTIVHFATVLLLSAVLNAPWHGIGTAAVLWGLVGLCGVVYAVIVARRMRIQTAYQPDFEDWLFHILLPLAAYAMLAVSVYGARADVREALFGVAAAVLLLFFIRIYNTWDAFTYHIFVTKRGTTETERRR